MINFFLSLTNNIDQTEEEIMTEIVKNFDGYRFVPTIPSSQQVICPQLLYSYLGDGQVENASWFSTGSPTFLLQLLKSRDVELLQDMVFEKTKLSMSEVHNSTDPGIYQKNLPLLLFQTGYLTFAPTTQKNQKQYQLIFPNLDVKQSLSILIAQALFQGKSKNEMVSQIDKLKEF